MVKQLCNTPNTTNVPFMFLFLVFLYFFIPTVTSLDKVTISSLLDDSNSLLTGLFAARCSFSTLFHNMARSILPNHKCRQVIILLLKTFSGLSYACYGPRSWSMRPCLSWGELFLLSGRGTISITIVIILCWNYLF